MTFQEKYILRKKQTKSRLLVGLDPVISSMPARYNGVEGIFDFLNSIVDQTHDVVLGYKPNIAFFGQYGPAGLGILEKVCKCVLDRGAILLLDAKRGDIGNTNAALAREIFEYYHADATTLNPLLGFHSLKEFFQYTDKYMFVLNFTSNPESEQFFLYNRESPLYLEIADQISGQPNCGSVAGATKLEYLEEISYRVKDSLILVPGIGAQGGSLEESIKAIGEDKFIFNASRSIIYASSESNHAEISRNRVIEMNQKVQLAMRDEL